MLRKILQSSHKLRKFRMPPGRKPIFIAPCLTKVQHKENKKLVNELKMRRARGENVVISRGKVVPAAVGNSVHSTEK